MLVLYFILCSWHLGVQSLCCMYDLGKHYVGAPPSQSLARTCAASSLTAPSAIFTVGHLAILW